MRKARITKMLIGLASLALVAAACTPVEEEEAAPQRHDDHEVEAEGITPAMELRTTLFKLLGEHVNLAAAATGQALAGNENGFAAAAEALDANSVDLAAAVGSVYGDEAENAFLPLWREHIDMFVNYTTGLATGDQAQQDQAVQDLTEYSREFGAFLESATDGRLPTDTVADGVMEHVLTLKDVVDAQAASDFQTAYNSLRPAYAHMQMIGDALTTAITDQFPDAF